MRKILFFISTFTIISLIWYWIRVDVSAIRRSNEEAVSRFQTLYHRDSLKNDSLIQISLKIDSKFKLYEKKKNIIGQININTANIDELMQLEGIGEKTARAIILYRESEGSFSNIDDIKYVKGIGKTKFKKIKDFIKVD